MCCYVFYALNLASTEIGSGVVMCSIVLDLD
jgi:hypothetical protein